VTGYGALVRPDLDQLRTADPGEAERFFDDVDPELLVQAVAAASDADLLELIGRDEIRSAAVAGILGRLHEFSLPERMARLQGVVRFDLHQRDKVLERHALSFDDGTMTPQFDVDDQTPADVVLTTSVLTFVRMVSGERNAGLEYLAGRLDIEGDADLALGLGGIFRVPGTDSIAVDPTALDPVDVATALKDVKGDHLAKVMHSGFRTVVLSEIFRRLPDFVDQKKSAKVQLCVGFRLTGAPSGDIERYVVEVDRGIASVTPGDQGSDHRDATVTCEGHDFLRLATGHMSPIAGVLKGQLKVKGDRAKALQLSSVIDIPQPR
jgi:putative sterol carrier protein